MDPRLQQFSQAMDDVDLNADPSAMEPEAVEESPEPEAADPELDLQALLNEHFGPIVGG